VFGGFMVWDLIKSILVMVLVVFAAYYVTKIVAKTGNPLRKNSRMKLISQIRLGKDSSIAMVEIDDYIYVLGVGSQRVELIEKLSVSNFENFDEGPEKPDFAEILKNQLLDRFRKPK
jgi:flagellar biogenesis protein FliO